MNIDISRIPFSRFGTYFCFSWLPVRDEEQTDGFERGLYLRSTHFGRQQELLRLDLHKGELTSPACASVTPSVMRLSSESGEAEICFESANTVRLRGRGSQLRLIPTPDSVSSASWTSESGLRIKHSKSYVTVVVTALTGSVGTVGECSLSTSGWQGFQVVVDPDDSGCYEIAIDLHAGAERAVDHAISFDDCVADVREEFDRFLEATPTVPSEYEEARVRAAYLNWSAVVEPYGFIRRPAMYMSKNWMVKVWSWDHCFNAMALSYKNPDLAWDQFMVPFDHQDQTGVIPDSVTDTELIWTWCKPPIHGWALRKMLDQMGESAHVKRQEIYGPLCRWTEWWFDYCDSDRDGIPEYHHGNDSGWDNSTVFQRMDAIESPDLSAHLVVQMEVLSQLAGGLGLVEESQSWWKRSADLLDKMIQHFWRGDEFVATFSGSHQEIRCDSLLPYISLVLGNRLPKSIARTLVNNLKTKGFLTEHGLATELPQSPYYVTDGYWRGPIWAPSTMLIVDGLHSLGEDGLVRQIVTKFAGMVQNGEFAENFDALTGEGLRDPAYTWTSSVFLILVHEYLMKC